MRKILMGVMVLAALLLAGVYLFIPGKLKVHKTVSIRAAMPGVSRSLSHDDNWKKWWPGETPFTLNKYKFSIRGKIFNAFDIAIADGTDSLQSRLDLLFFDIDSMAIGWDAAINTSINPFYRVAKHRQAKALHQNMQTILESMKAFMEKTENIYGFHVAETTVADSVLISTRRSFDHNPTVQEVDDMIQQLKKYIADNKAKEKNHPMLHVLQADADHYEAMVALPVDHLLPETKIFTPKFLLKGGNILETEVKGGPFTIENAFREFENYRSDHKYTSPAIPYQLLITDRVKESDTTRWITKLYYPVF
jgi:hypothetical protein